MPLFRFFLGPSFCPLAAIQFGLPEVSWTRSRINAMSFFVSAASLPFVKIPTRLLLAALHTLLREHPMIFAAYVAL